jgi:hypothetical protein
MARLLELSMLGISDAAFRLYVTAYTRANESGTRSLSCAAVSNLPGAPRNPKALGRLLLELIAHGLIIDGQGSYDVPEVLSAAATRMRRVRSEPDGTDGEHVREAFGHVPPNTDRTASENPPAPPLPQERFSSQDPESAPALSSYSKPESKRARKAPKKPWPADFDSEIRPRVFEWARGESYPDWWTKDRLEQMKIDCGAKSVMFADYYLGAIGWLRREDKQYGNGPDALLARQQRGVKPPGLRQHEQQQAEDARRRPELALFKPRHEPTETVSAAELERLARGSRV